MTTSCFATSTAQAGLGQQLVQQQVQRSHARKWQPRNFWVAVPQTKQSCTRTFQTSATTSDRSGVSAAALGKVSPDILKLLETQRNLLELNRNRLNALDELRVAKRRISELEIQLEQKSAKTETPSEAQPETAQLATAEQSTEPVPVQLHNAPTQRPNSPSGPVITVAYVTGWSKAMMHYSADGQAWSGLPGVRMEQGRDELSDSKVLQVRGTRLEFVLTNGKGQWDTPDPYGANQEDKNYIIDAPGSYRLQAGKLTKIS